MEEVVLENRDRLRQWALSFADSRQATWWLAFFSAIEASVFPVPPGIFMIALISARQEHRWFWYVLVTTVSSVLGGLIGYGIGFLFYDTVGELLIRAYSLEGVMSQISIQFEKHAFWTMFIAAFTPIPFKAFTIGAGFFRINILVFTIASFLGRFLRFVITGYIGKHLGAHILRLVYRYFSIVTAVLVLLCAIFLFFQVFR